MNQIQPRNPDMLSYEAVPERTQISMDDIFTVLRRYWSTILIVFLCCVGGTYLTLSFLTEQYDTKALLIVKLGRENLDAPSDARNNVFSTGVRHEEVMSEIELMKSPTLIDEVVEELGPDAFKATRVVPPGFFAKIKFYVKAVVHWGKGEYKELLYALGLQKRLDDREAAINELTGDLSVTWQKDTDTFEVAIRMADPELSRRILNQLLADYFVRRIEVRRGAGVTEFMSGESRQLESELAKAEKEEDAWKAQQHLSSVKDEMPLYLQRVKDLASEHDQTIRDIQTAEKQRDSLVSLIKDAPVSERQSQQDVPNPVIENYRQRLTALQAERAELLGKYKEGSTVIANKDDEIGRLRALIGKEQGTQTSTVTTGLNPVRQELEKRLHETEIAISGLTARSETQRAQLADLQGQVQRFDTAGDHLHDLERTRDLLESQYVALAKRKADADVAGALDASHVSNVAVVSAPYTEPQPAAPKKMLLMYVAIGAGLILGIGLALLLNYLDDEVHQVQDVRGILGVPCFGVVPAESL
jgi:uncharacterized protein involved in exopolysaccharide biosynthesis